MSGKRLIKVEGSYSLKQNRPNPFNPTTKIEFEIGIDGYTTLTFFDALGRVIAQPVSEWKSSGKYEVDFDATHLPSGMYSYLLRSGKYVDVKRMVVGK